MAHTIIACVAMGLCTVLAVLHDIDGSAALAVILGAAGIGGSGAASAAAVDRGYRPSAMAPRMISQQRSTED